MQIPNLIQDCHTNAIRPRNYAPQFESLWVPLESAKEPQTLEEVYVCVWGGGGAFPVTPPEFKVKPSTLSRQCSPQTSCYLCPDEVQVLPAAGNCFVHRAEGAGPCRKGSAYCQLGMMSEVSHLCTFQRKSVCCIIAQ